MVPWVLGEKLAKEVAIGMQVGDEIISFCCVYNRTHIFS